MSEMPDELRELLPHDIRLYVRNFWQHPNDPERDYDFYNDDKSEFLHYLADEDSPLNPRKWGDIVVLLFARGCLKTTIATAAAEWAVDQYPFVEVDVTAPRQEQYQEVMDRFKEHIRGGRLDALRSKDNLSHQKFERKLEKANGDTVHVESDVKARSAWGDGDALRGLHGHMGIVDEFQDVDESMFSTFLEAVDQSVPQVDYFPTIIIIGTPKMANSFFHELWQMSDQKDWKPNEGEGGAWVPQAEAEEFMPDAMREKREELREDIADLEEILADEDLDNPDGMSDGELRSHIEQLRETADGISGYNVTGWHIDQYASPLHDDAKIAFKKQKYSKRKFKNEVLAEFYTPENDLLSDVDLEEAMDDTKGFERARVYEDSTVVMGVDWGGGRGEQASDTVIVVGERFDQGGEQVIELRDITFLDHDLTKQDELEAVEQRIRDFEVDRVAVDEGYGAKQREDLQNGNNIWNADGWDRVCGVIYGNIKDKGEPKFAESGFQDSPFCTVSRTHMIENMVADFKAGKIQIPSADLKFDRDGDGTRLENQLTAPFTDQVETSGGKRKTKVQADRADDAFHAFTYMWMAANKFGSRRTLKKIGTHNRRGI
jgi:hypothetical protein